MHTFAIPRTATHAVALACLLAIGAAALASPAGPSADAAAEIIAPLAANAPTPAPTPATDAQPAFPPVLDAVDPPTQYTLGNTWLLIATALVFVMHLGFACLETGLTRAKNTVNILFKNVSIVAIGTLTYALVGFSIMYGTDVTGSGIIGWAGLGIGPDPAQNPLDYNDNYTYHADFIFQAMFAATAATIISGAVAERVKLMPFLIVCAIYVSTVYPVVGYWKWGGGFLDRNDFHDFAGSTIVHSVGGWGALAGAIVLGPRLGKFVEGRLRPIMGHNIPLAAIGVFLLWFGWFGFNGGSVLSASPEDLAFVFTTTMLAACAGVIGAMLATWIAQSKPDLTMVLNGALAGLVGITAGADVIPVHAAVIVGAIAGAIVVPAVILFDKLKVDDPVGAISVHLVCGIWGTLAVGLFSTNPDHTLTAQLTGVAATGALALPAALALFLAFRFTTGIRVSPVDERRGLDLAEHNQEAYPDFQTFLTR